MKYLKYEDYLRMGGTLSEAAFSRFAMGAEMTIRRVTFGRVDRMQTIPEAVKWLVFELVATAHKNEDGTARLSSESVGSWSKSYQVQSEEERKAETEAMIRNYLSAEVDDNGTPLLYLGVDA